MSSILGIVVLATAAILGLCVFLDDGGGCEPPSVGDELSDGPAE